MCLICQFLNRPSVKWKNSKLSGNPSGADGGGTGPGPTPLYPSSSPKACSSIHPIEVAPEARLEPPPTGAKPGGGELYLPSFLTFLSSSQSTGLGPCPQ